MAWRRTGCVVLSVAPFAVALASGGCGGRLDTSHEDTGAGAPTAMSSAGERPPAPPPDWNQDAEDWTSCPAETGFHEADVVTDIGADFKSPAPPRRACSEADLARLERNATERLKALQGLREGLSETCAACVFSDATDPAWGPFVLYHTHSWSTGFANFGACYASVSGSAACGRAIHYAQSCAHAACGSCNATSETWAWKYRVCTDAANRGMCRRENAAVEASCPSESTLRARCGPREELGLSFASVARLVRTVCAADP